MTCPTCIHMCATSEKQYAIRQQNMAAMPDAMPIPCPGCKSGDWATSRVMIKAEEVKPVKPWWRRTPSWRTMMYMCWFMFGFSLANISMTGNWYLQIANAFMAGFGLTGALNARHMIKLDAALKDMRERLDAIMVGSIEANIMPLLIAVHQDDSDPPSIAPRLH